MNSRILGMAFCLLLTLVCEIRFTGVAAAAEVTISRTLVLPSPGRAARETLPSDPVSALWLQGQPAEFHPEEGQAVGNSDPPRVWEKLQWNDQGTADQAVPPGSYLHFTFNSPVDQVMILRASGFSRAMFNGQSRGADMYAYDYAYIPVQLKAGVNTFLGSVGRGTPRLRLEPPPAPIFAVAADLTVPDVEMSDESLAGEPLWGSVIIVNATTTQATGLQIEARGTAFVATPTPVLGIPPLTIRKAPFQIRCSETALKEIPENRTLPLTLALSQSESTAGSPLPALDIALAVRDTTEARRRTFRSAIDGSVQYYAVRTATALSENDPWPALVLSCHGASVEAINQAQSYSSKPWMHLVAPTNRRPYGFDWEDFGRADALEVLGIAQRTLRHDPSRIYLTGHSMGGHGTWHIGATHPDRFAALGPSAGWISYQSYAQTSEGESLNAIEAIMQRGRKAGDTLGLIHNLKQHGIYILHGGADDNVPPEQARKMASTLETMHHDWIYHEQPGQNHWWGNEYDDGGTSCLDWPDMYDLFARHALPMTHSVRHVDFTTANPGASAQCHWATIYAQLEHQDYSRVILRTWPNRNRFEGTTQNVAILQLRTDHLRGNVPVQVVIDGQTLENITPQDKAIWLCRHQDVWAPCAQPPLNHKGPHRYGPIKHEAQHQFVLVYGTQGSEEDRTALYDKVRWDAETYWYRGNATPEIVSDQEFAPERFPDRTVILYGNRQTNQAWSTLLPASPLELSQGEVKLGDQVWTGDDLFVMFVQPRRDSDIASVIAVGASGARGMRAGQTISFFVPFVRFPDAVILRCPQPPEARLKPLAAGYFGHDWSMQGSEFEFDAP